MGLAPQALFCHLLRRFRAQHAYCYLVRSLILQVVELQADGVGAGRFKAVKDTGYVAVRKMTRSLDEHSLLYTLLIAEICT